MQVEERPAMMDSISMSKALVLPSASDDEIQFIGSRTPARPTQQPTAVTLHAEQMTLTVQRPKTGAILVGRRPPSDGPGEPKTEDGKAMFRCPVVSRRHAEISFSATGQVYITDLNSHHGTHVRQAHEALPTAIPPNKAHPLHQNDVVTFGKTVARNNELVTPIVARVQMHYPPQTPPPSSGTGRYGLPSTAEDDDEASSSSSMSVSSGRDSDVEEMSSFAPVPTRSLTSIIPSTLFVKASDAIRKLTHPLPSPSPQPPSDIYSPESPLSFDDCFDASYNDIFEDEVRMGKEPEPEPSVIGAWPVPTSPRSSSPVAATTEAVPVPPTAPELATAELKEDINKLHVLRRKYKARFNTNVEVTKARLESVEEHVGELSGLCAELVTQVDRMSDTDLPDVLAQIEQVREEVSEWKEEREESRDEYKDLIEEMRIRKAEHEEEMQDILCKAREAVKEMEAKNTSMDIDGASLKRKRDTDDALDVARVDVKRSKTAEVASMLFKTTATVTVGAVAAWGALAFI